MESQKRELKRALADAGWRLSASAENDLPWWADELWTIESSWNPSGFTLFLTFLVDPQYSGARSKGDGVWAVGVSTQLPAERAEAEGSRVLPLRPKFNQRLPAFIRGLSTLRDAAV